MGRLLQSEQNQQALPDIWELVYRAALAFAKAAAVDELLSNYTSSLRAYAKVRAAAGRCSWWRSSALTSHRANAGSS